MDGVKRNSENDLRQLLAQFPIVAIIGSRQSGKTTLARSTLPEWHYVDLENPADLIRIAQDPLFFFSQYPQHLIIDEAQNYPDLYPVLRGVIDAKRQQKGRFILTGSSSPQLLSQLSETLAGRIAIIELGTLKTNEQFEQTLSPFYDWFEYKLDKQKVKSFTPTLTQQQCQKNWLYGGYPEPVLANDTRFFERWMSNYYQTYIERDIYRLFPKLNHLAYSRFIQMLAALSGTIINRSELARAIEVSEKTIREYIQIAAGTFLWRNIPSYEKSGVKTIIKMPKGYIRDSGLQHYLLKINDMESLQQHPQVGRSFESFVIEEIIKGLTARGIVNWDYYYYRTRAGAEIDLILEGIFGLLPIEIKHGIIVKYRQLTALEQFIKQQNCPFGILVNHGTEMTWLSPTILQLPINYL